MHKALKNAVKSAILTASLVGLSTSAMAQLTPAQQQAIDNQTGISSPGRADGQIFQEILDPRVSPRVNVKKLQIQGAPEGAENIRFNLNSIRMQGGTVYSDDQYVAMYAAKAGQTITLAELYEIAAEITRTYRNDGYLLTQVVVPPQTIDNGVASLNIVEGFVDNIEVRGPEGADMELIRDYASHIRTGGPLNSTDLERSLLLINDVAGVSSRAVLDPSPNTVGAANLIIMVERKAYDAQIGIDNHGTRFLGPVQLSAAGSLNSFFSNNERITAQFVVAPDADAFNELMYGAIIYEQPVWDYGTVLEIAGTYTATDPGFRLRQFGVNGYSGSLSAQLEHPFVRTRELNLNGRVRFDYREVTTKNNIPIDPTRRDHIRTLRFGGSLETIDDLIGVAYNILDVELSRGMDILGSNKNGQIDMSRPGADPTFVKLNAEFQRLQRVTNNVNVLFGFKGQWSDNPLLSSEEFGVGGTIYGRGYDNSEIIGEEGIAGKAEIQWNTPYVIPHIETYQLYSFYDAGRVWNGDAATLADKKETITSAGFGVRANFNALTEAGLAFAWPLNNTPQSSDDRDPRVYVNVNRRF